MGEAASAWRSFRFLFLDFFPAPEMKSRLSCLAWLCKGSRGSILYKQFPLEPKTDWLGEISEDDSAGEEEESEEGLICEGGLEVSDGARLEEVGLRDSAGTLEDVGLRDSGVSQGRNKEDGIRNWRGGLSGVSGVNWRSPSSELLRSGVLSDIFTFLKDFCVRISRSQCKQRHTVTGPPGVLPTLYTQPETVRDSQRHGVTLFSTWRPIM